MFLGRCSDVLGRWVIFGFVPSKITSPPQKKWLDVSLHIARCFFALFNVWWSHRRKKQGRLWEVVFTKFMIPYSPKKSQKHEICLRILSPLPIEWFFFRVPIFILWISQEDVLDFLGYYRFLLWLPWFPWMTKYMFSVKFQGIPS